MSDGLYLIFHLLGMAGFSSTFQMKVGLKIDPATMALHCIIYTFISIFHGNGAKPYCLTPQEKRSINSHGAEPWGTPVFCAQHHDLLRSGWEGRKEKVGDFFAGVGCSSRACGG